MSATSLVHSLGGAHLQLLRLLGAVNLWTLQRVAPGACAHHHQQRRLLSSSQQSEAGDVPTSAAPAALAQVLRTTQAAEVLALGFFHGQQAVRRGRVDLAHFHDQEKEACHKASALLPQHRARPSLLQGLLKLGGVATGVAAGLAPPPLQLAIWGAVSEAVEEHMNDSLREVLQAAAAGELAPEQVHQVKEALRALRDVQRAPDGAPAAPDLVALQQAFQQGGGGVAQVGVEGVAALAVKLVGKAAMGLARQL